MVCNVLFLCTGNSARSIMAEALMTELGASRGFKGYSAGSHPKGQPHPLALQTLAHLQMPSDGLRSKAWDEFAQPGAPALDFVITVCDQAAGEVCPIWPGQPMIAHWGSPDPAAAEGTEDQKFQCFVNVASQIARRVELFCAFPDDKLLDAVAVRGVGGQFKLEDEAAMKR